MFSIAYRLNLVNKTSFVFICWNNSISRRLSNNIVPFLESGWIGFAQIFLTSFQIEFPEVSWIFFLLPVFGVSSFVLLRSWYSAFGKSSWVFWWLLANLSFRVKCERTCRKGSLFRWHRLQIIQRSFYNRNFSLPYYYYNW